MTRREFFSIWAGAAAYGATPAANGRVLVVVQLAGGNDGLSTVVPYEDDAYGRARTTLRLAAKDVRKIAPALGFHPVMGGFERLFQDGRLSVVQGVGYPKMDRDHNRAMRNWQTASPEERAETGWLGRTADRCSDPESGNVPAVFVGRSPRPLTIRSREVVVPALLSAADWTLRTPSLQTPVEGPGLLAFAARTGAAARADARAIVESVRSQPAPDAYPQCGLAESLRTVAQLMRASLGIRIYLVEHGGVSPGGYDNHSNQSVNHPVLLRELSDSVAAFCDDLARDRLLDSALLMTYSEFGRTLGENGRHGTGHGAAAPVFLAGGKVTPGLAGAHPSLTDLEGDAPKPHTDFRAVYATALDRWLGIPSETILGARFAPLDIVG